MANILVIRLSAIGDVAMTVPLSIPQPRRILRTVYRVDASVLDPGFYQPPEERERDRYQYEEHGENVGGIASFCLCLGEIRFRYGAGFARCW